MPLAWATAGAAVLGAGASIYASNKAASATKSASDKATALTKAQFDQTSKDLSPYREAGNAAVGSYSDAIGLNGPDAQQRAFANFRADPGYQYQQDEGQRAIEASSAARGGVLNGGTLRALQRTSQGIADQGYNSYLSRFMNLTNTGENAAARTGELGAAAAGQEGGYITNAGNAAAGSYLNMGNQVTGALGNSLAIYGYNKGQNTGTKPAPENYIF